MKTLFTSKLTSPGAQLGAGCFGGLALTAIIFEGLNLGVRDSPFKSIEWLLILLLLLFTGLAVYSWTQGRADLTIKENPNGGITIDVIGSGKHNFTLRDVKFFTAQYMMVSNGSVRTPQLWILFYDSNHHLVAGFNQGKNAFAKVPQGYTYVEALAIAPPFNYSISGIEDLLMLCARHLSRL